MVFSPYFRMQEQLDPSLPNKKSLPHNTFMYIFSIFFSPLSSSSSFGNTNNQYNMIARKQCVYVIEMFYLIKYI